MIFKYLYSTLLAFIAFTSTVFAAENTRPNILLIMADDVGSDAIGCYGGQSYPTPHIDALAAGGMKFNHGYSMPVCHPSRISLMTGRYPFRFGKEGSKWGGYPKAAEGISIGDRMKNGGYATVVAGKWQLCMMKDELGQPKRTGFDQWLLFGWHEGGRFNDPLLYETGKLRNDTSGQYGPDLYVDFLNDFMRKSQKEDKPFFVYYPMALCHDVTDDLKDEHVAFYRDGRWMTYAEMIASMDDMVGRMVRAVDEMGARDNTLIIFTTDNGTPSASYHSVSAKGKMTRPKVYSIRDGKIVPGGKGKMDDTGTRVPFIANWPGRIEAGTEVENMVDLTDLLPTVAEVAGLKDDGVPRDGISFAPILFGKKNAIKNRPWVFIEHKGKRAIRSPWWKLHGNGNFYDLKNDPGEASPLEVKKLSDTAKENYEKLSKAMEGMQGAIAE